MGLKTLKKRHILNENQKTIKTSCRYSGITLHTGIRSHLTLNPAPEDSGIVIVRADLPNQPSVNAIATNVIDVQRATTIAHGEAKVHTVEHVLAALYAFGIDNAIIEMDGPEPPIADGSSAPYVDLIKQTGSKIQKGKKKYFIVKEPLFVESGESRLILLPRDNYQISCTVKYGNGILDTQYSSIPINAQTFEQDISKARTFCLYREIEELMVKGLIKGGSLDNAVILKDGVVICKDELRYDDEFVRHKMLDIIGDLSLSGFRIIGEVVAIKPGHPLNVELAKLIQLNA